MDLAENFANKGYFDELKLTLRVPFKMRGKQEAQKSRIASWLMRLYAKPDLEKTVEQVARSNLVQR